MNTKTCFMALATLAASAAFAALPDKAYIVDYWTPPVDMVPSVPIAEYNPSVRVPEYFWLKYDGAYSLALRLHPIAAEKLEKEIQVGLIDTNRNKSARAFSAELEKQAKFRRVGIYNLDLDATEFTALSFKVRAKAKNAGDVLAAYIGGKGFNAVLKPETAKTFEEIVKGAKNEAEAKTRLATAVLKEEAKDGFVGYTLPFTARPNARITSLEFELPAATTADFEQSFEIIDFHLKRSAPKARFEDLEPRTWVKKDGKEPVGDIYAYARGAGAADTIAALPGTYELRPQLKDESDGGYKVEYVKAKVAGQELPAVKITLTKGPRCLLRFPVKFDGLDYNTMTFLGKVEVFGGAKPVLGDDKPMLWGTNQDFLNRPFDTFQVSYLSLTDDFCDWTRWGLAQADYCQNKDLSCAASQNKDGWRAFAYDIANSDPSNNKSSFYTKLTHWCFYYNNAKIPEGKQVVVTIADPRLTKGVMLTGGDMAKYENFLKTHDPKKVVDFGALKTALEPPAERRLAEPIPFVRNHKAQGQVCFLGAAFPRDTSAEARTAYTKIVTEAIKEFTTVLERRCGILNGIPVTTGVPKDVKNSIIVGGDAYARLGKEQKATFEADMKALAGKPGCAIRAHGSNIYIYAPADYNYVGNARGLAFALYELLENNTDLIYTERDVLVSGYSPVFGGKRTYSYDPSGDFDLVWGDGFVHAPKVPEASMEGPGQNRNAGYNWVGDWQFGRHRTRSTNHWWGYGTEPQGNEERDKPNVTWGIDANGKPMVPGCYTGHPCLIKVLDRARESYLYDSAWAVRKDCFAETQPAGKAFAWKCFDINGLWVEDSISMCQCAECLTAIRLADGSLVDRHSPYFRSTQYYSNGSAMINAVNVYANRKARVESIGYFWMAPVPLMTVSRNYDIRFCPYIRKNYFVPIFAPMNDMHWRAMNAWGQQDVHLALYEYFLCIGIRPFADVAVYDFNEEVKLHGFYDWMAESEHSALARMERWVMERLLWGGSGEDIPKLRAYFLKRTYREGAEAMARFYTLAMSCAEEKLTFASPMEFEDDQIIYRNAMRTKGEGMFAGTVADELEKCVAEAEKAVKDPFAAAELKVFRKGWDKYKADAVESEKRWWEDVKGGASSKPMKIVGAPD